MISQLRKKFIWVTMSIVTVMLIIIFFLVYNFTAWNLNSQADAVLDELLLSAPHSKNHQLPYFTISVNAWGKMHVEGATDLDIDDETFIQSLLDEVDSQKRRDGTLSKYHLKYRIHTGHADWKVAFVDTSSHQNTLWALVQISILVGFVSLIAFFVVSVLLARWATAPVNKAWQKQKQFISDASHELKTPLTVIMSNAELLQNDNIEPAAKDRYCENILTMTRQMRHLTEGMLELARADNGKVKQFFQPLDLSALISQAALPFEPVLFEKELLLQTDIAPHISLTGSKPHLRQVVEILLDNACKYASPGRIHLTLSRQGRYALLSVSNPGAPIPQEDRERIFERFYRIDQARQQNGSFGLGLSIARSIVADHGGKIWVESNHTGNCFFVQLPL